MPVNALERFRQLVHTHHQGQGAGGAEKLTEYEIHSALTDLHPEDRLEAREIALDAMLKVDLSDDALLSLQNFLGIQPGVPSTTPVSTSPGTRAFAVRLLEAQGEDSVGGTKVWKWEMEQALKTLGSNVSPEELQRVIRAMLASVEITPSALASTRMFVDEGRIESAETLSWPSNGSPAHFGALTGVLGETVENAYNLTRTKPNTDLSWSGPSTPPFALAGDTPFAERLTVEKLLASEQTQGRDPLDVIMGIGVQLGMEQGRRAVMSSPGIQQAKEQLGIIESAAASGDMALARQALESFLNGLQNPMLGGPTGSLVRPDGTRDWPDDDLPVSLDELAGPLRKLLEETYNMERLDPNADIPWFGPTGSSFMATMPFHERLTAANLRAEAQSQGRDTLDVLVDMTLQLGMEQGRRMTLSQDFSQVTRLAEMALTAIDTGQIDSAKFMIPMLRQMWNL